MISELHLKRQEQELAKLRAVETAARRVLDTVFFFGDSAADLRAALDDLAHFDNNTETARRLEESLARLENLPPYDYEAVGNGRTNSIDAEEA